MRTLFLAAALSGTMLAGLAGTAAVAQQGGGGGGGRGGMMMRADTNGDGIITHDEYLAQVMQRFERMDADHDGKLSGDELRGPMAERAQGGAITKDQFTAEADARFQRMDTNHDGKLTQDEMQAMMQRFRDHAGRGGDGQGGPDGAPAPGGEHGPRGDMFDKLDTNHDGRISRDEMRAVSDERFAKLDTNHDGFVDKAEMAAARGKHHGHGDMPPPPADGADKGPGQ